MLRPVRIIKNIKVTDSESIILESLSGINLPLLQPGIQIYNRTTADDSITFSLIRTTSLTNQTDPDFNGILEFELLEGTLGEEVASDEREIGYPLTSESLGQTTVLNLANAGPAVEALVTVILTGVVEVSVGPDPSVVVNI